MASSLDPIRRHSKLILTILGVICMITFVVGSQLEQLLAPPQSFSKNDVVATWSGGKIRDEDLYRMRAAHERLQKFLRGIAQATQTAGGQLRPIGLSRMQSERQLVQLMLWGDEAKRMGIVVNDDAVRNYINDFCSYTLTDAQIDDIAYDATGPSVSRDELYEQLKREITAQEARLALNSSSVAGNVSVADAWDYYGRLFRQMTIEAYPFATADFMEKVEGGPNEAEKRKIFEDFRLNNPDPDSAEPGFYRPLKLAFAYAKVDMAPYLEEAKKKITEEQIQKEYDTQVKQGRLKVPVEQPKKDDEKKPEDENKEGDKKEGDKKEGDKKEDRKEGSSEQPKADDKKDEKKEEKPAEPPAKKCGDELEGDELAQADEKKEPEKKEPEKKEPEKKEPEKKEPEATKPEDTKPEDKKPDETEKSNPEKKPEPPKEPEMRTQTLEEAREAILTQLAQPEAAEKVKQATTGISNAIRDYYTKYLRHQEASKRLGAKVEKLEPFDIEAVAAKYHVVGGTTPLINEYEAAKYDIGKNGMEFNFEALRMGLDRSYWQLSFVNLAFHPRAQLFNAQEIGSMEPDVRYVYCVTDKKDPENPKYEDPAVQEEIKAAWKKGKALELARAAAKKLAEEAKGKDSLADVAPDAKKVLSPDPFSYLTYGAAPTGQGAARYSFVKDLPNVQRDFFEAIYRLPAGGTASAADGGLNTVYAVKMKAVSPSDEDLRQRFLDSGIGAPVLSVAQIELARRGVAQLKHLETKHNLKWQRPPGYLESGE